MKRVPVIPRSVRPTEQLDYRELGYFPHDVSDFLLSQVDRDGHLVHFPFCFEHSVGVAEPQLHRTADHEDGHRIPQGTGNGAPFVNGVFRCGNANPALRGGESNYRWI